MKFVTETYGNKKTIFKLANAPYVAIPVMVDDEGVTANENGKKIVPAGTIVAGKTEPVLLNPGEPVIKKNTADAEGILINDVDVTYGSAPGAMAIMAFIDLNKIPEEPTEEAVDALNMIKFIK